jgi:hypothetical protein
MRKQIQLLLFIVCSVPVFGQITSDSIVGTWTNTSSAKGKQQLIFTSDSVTVYSEYPNPDDSNEWLTTSYSGPYSIIKGDQIHVIFNDKPREEAFYKVVRAEDGSLQIIVEALDKKKKLNHIYKRE